MVHRALTVAISLGIYFSVSARVYSQEAVSQAGAIAVSSQPLQFQQGLTSLQSANVASIASLNPQTLPGPALSTSQQAALQRVVSSQPQLKLTFITDIAIPENATDALADLYTAKANLLNDDIAKYNAGSITSTTKAGAALSADEQTVSKLNATVAAQQPTAAIPPPQTPLLPANASPALRAFILKRNELMREELQVYNQYVSADAATRESALAAWRNTNASQFTQLQQMARNLSSTQN